MAELHVRNIPDDLHAALRERAREEGRSMSSQSIVLLEAALKASETGSRQRSLAIERLREIQARSRLPEGAPAAEALIRRDRDERG